MKLKAMTFNVQHFKNYRSEEWFSFEYSRLPKGEHPNTAQST